MAIDQLKNFSLLLGANFFNSGLSSFVGPNSISKTSLVTETPAPTETTVIEALVKAAAIKAPTSLYSTAFSVALSNVKAHEGGYKHLDIALELSTILSESIITTHRKTFIKTNDLVDFNRLKKHSKVWDHSTQLLEFQSRKKYWLYNYYMQIVFF